MDMYFTGWRSASIWLVATTPEPPVNIVHQFTSITIHCSLELKLRTHKAQSTRIDLSNKSNKKHRLRWCVYRWHQCEEEHQVPSFRIVLATWFDAWTTFGGCAVHFKISHTLHGRKRTQLKIRVKKSTPTTPLYAGILCLHVAVLMYVL